MKNKISLNTERSIDLPTLLDTRLLVQANSGGGKSWLLRRILEQSHGQVQHIVIDLEGEFATLREQYDYVLAGKEGDTPADPKSAGLLARKLLELNVSAIIDLYELHYQDRKHFVRLFLESMINAPKSLWHPCLVVIDEAHKFCPEKEQSEASSAVIDLATLGRKRGYCAILATQRLSKLHKDAAAECNNKLIGRTNLDVDMKRAGEELGFTSKEKALALRHLQAGEFFAFGPAISQEVIEVQIGDVTTTHPKAGSRLATATPIPPPAKIRAILGKLKDLPQEALQEAQTIEGLRHQITLLTQELAQKKQVIQKETVIVNVHRQVQTALQKQQQVHIQEKQLLTSRLNELQSKLTSIRQIINDVQAEDMLPEGTTESVRDASFDAENDAQEEKAPIASVQATDRILLALASRHPMKFTKAQLATITRYAVRGGAYLRHLRVLKDEGYITLQNGFIQITDQGKVQIQGHLTHEIAHENIIAMWQRTLTGGARRIFDVVASTYPQELSREEIGQQTGLTPRGGAFGRYVSILRNNGLIEVEGRMIKASNTLFL